MAAFQRMLHASSSTLPRQCASAAVLFATGDAIAQQAVEKRGANHDLVRTARLATYGGAIFAPIMGTWFGKVLERVNTGSRVGNIATKLALDQFFMSPVIICVFFTSTTLMEGKSLEDAKAKIQKSWAPTYKAALGVWAPVQALNFAVVPVNLRLLFVNAVSVGWNTYLSVQSAGGQNEAKVDAKVDALEAPIVARLQDAAHEAKKAGQSLEAWLEKEGGELKNAVSNAGAEGLATLEDAKRQAEKRFAELRK